TAPGARTGARARRRTALSRRRSPRSGEPRPPSRRPVRHPRSRTSSLSPPDRLELRLLPNVTDSLRRRAPGLGDSWQDLQLRAGRARFAAPWSGQALVPGEGGGVGEGRELVDDDPAAFPVVGRAVP